MSNHQFTIKILVAALAIACLGTITCTAKYPNGKMVCDPLMGNSDCPAHWSCIEGHCYNQVPAVEAIGFDATYPFDGYTYGSVGSDGSTTSVIAPPCVPVTKCEPGQCGKLNACSAPLDCGACPNNFICQNNKCGTTTECVGCTIDGMCYDPGAIKPGSGGCELCMPATSKTTWTPNDGAACDDGKFCVVMKTCKGTQCVGSTRNCDDGCQVTNDICSEAKGVCVNECMCKSGEVCNCNANKCDTNCKSTECKIDGACYADKKVNPPNDCQICDATQSKIKWTIRTAQTCGKASEKVCEGQPTCSSSGECKPTPAKEGTACGNTKDEDCSLADTCDGNGNCLDNHKKPDVKCGEPPKECENQRYCDGNGTCAPQTYLTPGTACGAKITDNTCLENRCDASHKCTPTSANDGQQCGAGDNTCIQKYQCSGGQCIKVNWDNHECRKADKNACIKSAICINGTCPNIEYYDGTTACDLKSTNNCVMGKCSGESKGCVSVKLDDTTLCGTNKICCDGTCKDVASDLGGKATCPKK